MKETNSFAAALAALALGGGAARAQTAPVITQDLVNQTALAGSTVKMSVAVAGTGPFTFQWQFNGTNISSGIISTLAGTGNFGFAGDGIPATNASLGEPYGVAVDSLGDVFIADTDNQRIREVNVNGFISTVAGNGGAAFAGDGGPATQAALDLPYGVGFDNSGLLLIADTQNNRIRRVGANGIITTIAGDSSSGFSGNGNPATNSSLANPRAVAADGEDNLLIADTLAGRIMDVNFGLLFSVAGGGASNPGDGGLAENATLAEPQGIAVDASGNTFIADMFNNRIRRVDQNGIITTVAGNGTNGFSGDGGAATNAKLRIPGGVAVDAYGNIFIADTLNNRVREMSTNGVIFTVVGGGLNNPGDGGPATNAILSQPNSIAVDSYGNLFIADTFHNRIRKVNLQGPVFAINNLGTNNAGSYDVIVTGPGGSVTSSVVAITEAFPPNITAQPLSQVMKPGANTAFSVAANGTAPYYYQWYFDGAPLLRQTNATLGLTNVSATNAGSYQVVVANPYTEVESEKAVLLVVNPTLQPGNQIVVAGSTATLNISVAASGPLTYVWNFDQSNYPASIMITAAGKQGTGYSGDGGSATNATLDMPAGVAADSAGDLFIADSYNNRVREVSAGGIITTVAGTGYPAFSGDGGLATNADLVHPTGVALDAAGNLFIADSGNARIRKVSTNGIISTFAGTGNTTFSGDGGPATNAALNMPWAVAVTASGNLLIADTDNNRIRQVAANGTITTVAGKGGNNDTMDGVPATNATLNTPFGVAADSYGNIFIADTYNHRVRQVGLNGIISTVAGTGFSGSTGDSGPATNANLNQPASVAVDGFGTLYIADNASARIRKVGANGIITTAAGNGLNGYSGDGGSAISESLDVPQGVALDPSGNLLIADADNNRIRKVIFQGPTLVLTNVTAANAGTYSVEVFGYSNNAVSSSPETVAVVFPAAISNQPQSQVVLPGSSASFNVSATGTGTISYQWYFGATPLGGQTGAALALSNVNTNNSGSYDVVVTNLYGSATSSVAFLTVLLAPQNFQASLGNAGNVQLQFSGSPNYDYVLQEATNLAMPINWQAIATNLTDTNGIWRFTDSNAPAIPAGFYRAVLPGGNSP